MLGRNDVAAWWRTLKSGGQINDRYPGGAAAHRAGLEIEGHIVGPKGKRLWMKDWQAREFDLLSAIT